MENLEISLFVDELVIVDPQRFLASLLKIGATLPHDFDVNTLIPRQTNDTPQYQG
jgi:hypothetical protein